MDEFILHPATITKDELRQQARCRGSVNRDAVTVGGEQYESGSLVLVGFVGNHIGDQRYQGHYRLRLVQPRDTENDFYGFTQLPGWSGVLVEEVDHANG